LLEQAEGDLRLQTNAFDGDRLVGIPVKDLSVSELRARAANELYKATMESWEEGLALMQRAVSLNPLDGMSLAMRVEAQLMLYGARYKPMPDDVQKRCAEDLNTAVMQIPKSDYVIWVRGNFRLALQDDVMGARADLKRCRLLNPAYLENHELEGQILLREADFSGADVAFSRLVERGEQDPLQPYRLFMRGVTRFCAGNFEGAAQDASAAHDLRPNEAGHLKLRAMALTEMHLHEQARQCLNAAQRLPQDPVLKAKPPVLPPELCWVLDKLKPTA